MTHYQNAVRAIVGGLRSSPTTIGILMGRKALILNMRGMSWMLPSASLVYLTAELVTQSALSIFNFSSFVTSNESPELFLSVSSI